MKRHLTLMASVIGLVLYGGTAAASAATAQQGPSTHDRYCIAEAVPLGSSLTPTMTCYHSFAASIKAATGGRVRLPASAKPGSVTPDELNAGAESPATTFVLSIDYQNIDFGGQSLIWQQSTKCGSFQASSMPSGWNDVISSVAAESGCATTLFQNTGFTGSTFKIAKNGTASSLGSFNDQASSQKWCPTYPCT